MGMFYVAGVGAMPAIGTTGNPRGANSDKSDPSFTSWMYADVLISHASGARNQAAIAPTYGNSIGPAISAVMIAATATLIQNPRAITIRQLVRSASITPIWRSTMRYAANIHIAERITPGTIRIA